jgi:hypothetical protein
VLPTALFHILIMAGETHNPKRGKPMRNLWIFALITLCTISFVVSKEDDVAVMDVSSLVGEWVSLRENRPNEDKAANLPEYELDIGEHNIFWLRVTTGEFKSTYKGIVVIEDGDYVAKMALGPIAGNAAWRIILEKNSVRVIFSQNVQVNFVKKVVLKELEK